MVSVSCYGNTGPLADRPGAGTLAEAYGGLTYMTGEASGPPMLPSIPLGDSLSALSGVIGALVACYHNKVNGGGGQHVDVSFYEPVLTLLQPTIIAYDPAADEPPPMRTGRVSRPACPATSIALVMTAGSCSPVRPTARSLASSRSSVPTRPRTSQVRPECRSHRERRRTRLARRRMDRGTFTR